MVDYRQAKPISYFLTGINALGQCARIILLNRDTEGHTVFVPITGSIQDETTADKLKWGVVQ